MHIESLREYCLSKPGSEETFPFDEDTLVFKVMGKMYAATGLRNPESVNLKCDPERAVELREHYPLDIKPGWHMNKKHWNTVMLEERLPESMIMELIDHSYNLVVSSLTKKDRSKLNDLIG